MNYFQLFPGNKHQWNVNQNANILIRENTLENCEHLMRSELYVLKESLKSPQLHVAALLEKRSAAYNRHIIVRSIWKLINVSIAGNAAVEFQFTNSIKWWSNKNKCLQPRAMKQVKRKWWGLWFFFFFTKYRLSVWYIFKKCPPGRWFDIKMSSYQYRKSHCGDKTILSPQWDFLYIFILK